MSHTDVDHAAADAVVAHHSELAAALIRRVALLRAAARAGSGAARPPRPLLAGIERRFPGQIDSEWLQQGPDVWQIRLHRQYVAA